MIKNHNIHLYNIWNMDEKGFLIGVIQRQKRLVPVKDLESGLTRGSLQDGNRSWITIVGCVNAIGITMPPSIIFKSTTGDLQDTWIEDFDDSKHEAYFTSSVKGWTNDELGKQWIERFHEATFQYSGYHSRLLLLDGHSSHVTIDFMLTAAQKGILLVVLPPHSTHRLQPLDLGVYGPLSHYYSEGIDNLIRSSRGFSSMSQRLFWSMFFPAWQKATKVEVITSAWAKSGIYPWSPCVVIDQLEPVALSKELIEGPKMVSTCRQLRRVVQTIYREERQVSDSVKLLCNSIEALCLENELLRAETKGLVSNLVNEKKRRKRGKPLGLNAGQDPSKGQFYSPTKIYLRRDEIAREEQQEIDKKVAKEAQKIADTNTRAKRDLNERIRIDNNKLVAAWEKAEKQAETTRKKIEQEGRKLLPKTPARSKRSQILVKQRFKELRAICSSDTGNTVEPVVEPMTTRRGRNITQPIRFLD
jgi:hypothetical protein